jgi:hypothetical protein
MHHVPPCAFMPWRANKSQLWCCSSSRGNVWVYLSIEQVRHHHPLLTMRLRSQMKASSRGLPVTCARTGSAAAEASCPVCWRL